MVNYAPFLYFASCPNLGSNRNNPRRLYRPSLSKRASQGQLRQDPREYLRERIDYYCPRTSWRISILVELFLAPQPEATPATSKTSRRLVLYRNYSYGFRRQSRRQRCLRLIPYFRHTGRTSLKSNEAASRPKSLHVRGRTTGDSVNASTIRANTMDLGPGFISGAIE